MCSWERVGGSLLSLRHWAFLPVTLPKSVVSYPTTSPDTMSSSRRPAPISFPASQYFEGNDGQWSSFVVRVGTPEENFRVFPGTVLGETFVPMAGACKEGAPVSVAVYYLLTGSMFADGRCIG